ncbi:MAG: transcription elongation factor GreA [Flavobacteriales bacterium]|nr:transcription elongation factor GreA [Flavobacteriales bacterium]|tara:strand:+ start:5138 stop:5611 length:474 start_codon:yes stop_codon:yes gene_type:complete
MTVIYLSQKGYDDLKNQLDHLISVERPKIIKQIAEARDKGDLSENAEYDAAKEAQGLLETKISKLEIDLSNARVLNKENLDSSSVHLLSTVVIQNIDSGQTMTYTIVSESEADLVAKKISASSPIGKGLLGKSVGDIVKINVPKGILKFKVIDISIE